MADDDISAKTKVVELWGNTLKWFGYLSVKSKVMNQQGQSLESHEGFGLMFLSSRTKCIEPMVLGLVEKHVL